MSVKLMPLVFCHGVYFCLGGVSIKQDGPSIYFIGMPDLANLPREIFVLDDVTDLNIAVYVQHLNHMEFFVTVLYCVVSPRPV